MSWWKWTVEDLCKFLSRLLNKYKPTDLLLLFWFPTTGFCADTFRSDQSDRKPLDNKQCGAKAHLQILSRRWSSYQELNGNIKMPDGVRLRSLANLLSYKVFCCPSLQYGVLSLFHTIKLNSTHPARDPDVLPNCSSIMIIFPFLDQTTAAHGHGSSSDLHQNISLTFAKECSPDPCMLYLHSMLHHTPVRSF